MQAKTRRVAVVGGNRIPFARSNTVYADASNQEMLTAAIDGLVDPLRPRGRAGRRGRRRRRAQALPRLQPHPRVGARLQARPRDPGVRHPAGLRHRHPGGDRGRQQDRPRPDRGRHRRRHRHHLGRADRGQREAAQDPARGQPRQDPAGPARGAAKVRPAAPAPSIPQNSEPRTGLSMGESAALTALEWQIGREEQDELAVASHHNLAASYDRGFHDDLVTPFRGLERDQNLRPDSSVEKLATLKPVFGKGETATMTAGQLHPAHRRRVGGAAVLRGVRRAARLGAAGLPDRLRDRRRRLRARR